MSHALSFRRAPLVLLFLAATVSGCREAPLVPPPAPAAASEWPSVVSIFADDLLIAEITHRETIASISRKLPIPPRNPEHLLEMGSFATGDQGFIAAVQEILADKQAVIGFSNPERMTWGRVKLLARR